MTSPPARRSTTRATPLLTIPSDEIRLNTSDYLLKGLVAPGELGVWFGPSGSGKSFVILEVAHAIATGRSVLGRRVRKAPVLICALEGAAGFDRRIVAMTQERGPAPDLHVYSGSLCLHESLENVDALMETINLLDAKLVIIDTLSRSIPGADENSAQDMTGLISTLGRVMQETGAAVIEVHHTGKDEGKGSRGHSSLKAAADVEIEISKSGTGGHTLKLTKVKDGRSDLEYSFTLREIDLGMDDDGDPITTCVIDEGGQRPSDGQSAKLTKGDREARGWLKEASEEFGEQPPLTLPAGVRATTKDRWLEIGKKRSGKADDTVRKQIDRAVTNLTLAKQMAVHAPYFWLLK